MTIVIILFSMRDIRPSFDVTITFIIIRNASITNCTISDNNGSGLFLYELVPTFNGNIKFINNTGKNCKGVFMISVSLLLL